MSTTPTSEAPASTMWTWLALLVAAGATAGSVYLSTNMGLYACPLCFYQRTFVMGVAALLLIGLLSGMGSRVSLAALAMPLAFAALAVALMHVDMERTGKLECPDGFFGLGRC